MASSPSDLFAKATRANAAGKLDEAIQALHQLLAQSPSNTEAMLLYAIVHFRTNDITTSCETLQQVVQLDPHSSDACFWLSASLRKLGRSFEALDWAKRALELGQPAEHALNQVGMCLLDLDKGDQAVSVFQQALEKSPNAGPILENLGRALQSVGRYQEAVRAYRRAISVGPMRAGLLLRLGDAYLLASNAQGAVQTAQSVLQMEPDSAAGNLLMARALIEDGRGAQALPYSKRAAELEPESSIAASYHGRALQSSGKLVGADEMFRRSIELEPHQGFAYHALIHNRKVTDLERPLIRDMDGLCRDPEMGSAHKLLLHYALGKALEDLGQFEPAMGHYDEANRIDHALKAGRVEFSKDRIVETTDFLIETFTREFLDRNLGVGFTNELPIFVVGMMRSGTTLAEQILSSHSKIGGVGEQIFWSDNAGTREKVFNGADAVDTQRIAKLCRTYLNRLETMAPGFARVVDKLPTNYLLLGVLRLALPNARIIHMRRHPVDTCISIWANPLTPELTFGGDRANLVSAYLEYLRLMSHWRTVLPADRLFEVHYEDLVYDQERWSRNMIEFCGLEWEEACLRPQDNPNTVRTPSVWQVRQPIYRTSTERWRKFETCLGAFSELMDIV
ncbi:MAG: sulfotransferase [Fimbriimonas sp.]|nr:sulfotransferase [Fimbriimonas sp.]